MQIGHSVLIFIPSVTLTLYAFWGLASQSVSMATAALGVSISVAAIPTVCLSTLPWKKTIPFAASAWLAHGIITLSGAIMALLFCFSLLNGSSADPTLFVIGIVIVVSTCVLRVFCTAFSIYSYISSTSRECELGLLAAQATAVSTFCDLLYALFHL